LFLNNPFKGEILSFGLLLADSKSGPFSIEIENIKAIRVTEQELKDYGITPGRDEE